MSAPEPNTTPLANRILEPEVMDSRVEALDYDAMDHRSVNERFVDDLMALAPDLRDTLDVGTGTAQIPLLLVEKSRDARVTAIDLAEAMLDVACENLGSHPLGGRIDLRQQDAKRMTYPPGRFSTVMSNSIVHHIPSPELVMAEILRVASPGATIFVRDLLRPNCWDELKRLVETYANGCNDHQRQMFSDSLAAALSLAEVRAIVTRLGRDPNEVQQTTDRHWTWAARIA
jgi:ubiquinone/menaquinone biosynthesis C-methylase UbiE